METPEPPAESVLNVSSIMVVPRVDNSTIKIVFTNIHLNICWQ